MALLQIKQLIKMSLVHVIQISSHYRTWILLFINKFHHQALSLSDFNTIKYRVGFIILTKLYLHIYAGSSESSPQSLSKSHIHSFGMHRPFLHANSVSGSHSLLSENKIDNTNSTIHGLQKRSSFLEPQNKL